jgi:hypothetical protein
MQFQESISAPITCPKMPAQKRKSFQAEKKLRYTNIRKRPTCGLKSGKEHHPLSLSAINCTLF